MDFKKESEKAISVFRDTMNNLNKINEEIFMRNTNLKKQMDEIHAESVENDNILKENNKMISNIENLLN